MKRTQAAASVDATEDSGISTVALNQLTDDICAFVTRRTALHKYEAVARLVESKQL